MSLAYRRWDQLGASGTHDTIGFKMKAGSCISSAPVCAFNWVEGQTDANMGTVGFSPGSCSAASCSSSCSSSIFDDSSAWSSDTAADGDGQKQQQEEEEEAQSAYSGPLDHMSALESSLPIKRPGLSKFFGGKARSFSSLADVSTTSDLEKPNNPYAKRRRMGVNGGPLDRQRSYPRLSRASLAGISKKTTNRSTLTVAIKLGGLTEENKDYVAALPGASRSHWTKTIPSRSFSLTDLPVVSRHASPPFRKSFAQP
ncbi:hypothetical protein BDL97_01G157100 [Sphagnum fallax]|uniref:Uncharacterized protein n=1 Tax=Sphagnum jensenii TaxID=128206 RepID=A0ABP1A7J0_9BRYO|nr:hypothetical protein BDL97_01G157100 [Sphagnum fallax]